MSEPIPMRAIRAIVEYNWSDEAADYEQAIEMGDIQPGDNRHIFIALKNVDEWLKGWGV